MNSLEVCISVVVGSIVEVKSVKKRLVTILINVFKKKRCLTELSNGFEVVYGKEKSFFI
jgi:hypothetical protein